MSITSEITRINNSIAAAYAACSDKGATMPTAQNSANLADTVSSIQQGGSAEVMSDYIDFIDTDGTILYSYTEAELQELTELPPLPERQGYTYQEWNWSLADIKAYGFPLVVGAVRVPTDGKTRLTFDLMYGGDLTVSIRFKEASNLNLTFDWGDGSTEVYSRSAATHTYAAVGRYVVKIDANDTFALESLNNNSTLVKAEFSGRASLIRDPLYQCKGLEGVSIPVNSNISSNSFKRCSRLKSVVIPSTVTSLSSFSSCKSLKMISLPKGILSIPNNCFEYCESIKRFSIPESQTEIKWAMFYDCESLQSIFIPAGITSITNNAFYNCQTLKTVDLSALTSVPTLAHTNAFGNAINAVFYVRNAEMLAAFQSATNWSTYANKMQIGGKYASI